MKIILDEFRYHSGYFVLSPKGIDACDFFSHALCSAWYSEGLTHTALSGRVALLRSTLETKNAWVIACRENALKLNTNTTVSPTNCRKRRESPRTDRAKRTSCRRKRTWRTSGTTWCTASPCPTKAGTYFNQTLLARTNRCGVAGVKPSLAAA